MLPTLIIPVEFAGNDPLYTTLSEDNFEHLIFLKGNLQLFKENFKLPAGVVEEEFSYYKGIKY